MKIKLSKDEKIILKSLSEGLTQKEISEQAGELELSFESLSSIEKKLKLLKKKFNANTNVQLIAMAIRENYIN